MQQPPDHLLPPGATAARMTDADISGFTVSACLRAADRFHLSPRERDVLFLSLADKCPAEIGTELGCETSYIRRVRDAVVKKLCTHDGMVGIRRRINEDRG